MKNKIPVLVAAFTLILIGFCRAYSAEAPKRRGGPTAYDLTWSLNGQKCLGKVGIDHYEVYDDQGHLVWSRTMLPSLVELSPDGTQLAVVLPSDGLYIYTLQPGSERKILNLQGTQNYITHLKWSPTGQKVAYWMFTGEEMADPSGQLRFVTPK